MWGLPGSPQKVNPVCPVLRSCLVKVMAEVMMTFRPDGGTGPKVREWLKPLGVVLWGPRVSTLNLMSVRWVVIEERWNKKLPLHVRVNTLHKRLHDVRAMLASALCWDKGAGAVPNCSSHNSGVYMSLAGGRANRWPEENSSFGHQQRATDDLMIISHSAIIYMGI